MRKCYTAYFQVHSVTAVSMQTYFELRPESQQALGLFTYLHVYINRYSKSRKRITFFVDENQQSARRKIWVFCVSFSLSAPVESSVILFRVRITCRDSLTKISFRFLEHLRQFTHYTSLEVTLH